jgi:hypothetical protein
MEQRFTDSEFGEVILAQTLRARRITLSVRVMGRVRLSYPFGTTQRQALAFLESHRAWIAGARERIKQRSAQKKLLAPPDLEVLRRQAKMNLPQRIARLSAACGLHYAQVSVRATRSKWGSCSLNNRITLSLYLEMLPEHLRDFVILHELCHTVHHDHSVRFHALLDQLTGGKEKLLNRELRSYLIVKQS